MRPGKAFPDPYSPLQEIVTFEKPTENHEISWFSWFLRMPTKTLQENTQISGFRVGQCGCVSIDVPRNSLRMVVFCQNSGFSCFLDKQWFFSVLPQPPSNPYGKHCFINVLTKIDPMRPDRLVGLFL